MGDFANWQNADNQDLLILNGFEKWEFWPFANGHSASSVGQGQPNHGYIDILMGNHPRAGCQKTNLIDADTYRWLQYEQF